MKTKKMLPIGIENFEDIRSRDYYYVDKTGLISELLENGSAVNLFTRPRRFGKSLNMNMLKAFSPMAAIRHCLKDWKSPGTGNCVNNIWGNFR